MEKIINEYNKQNTESTANPYWVIRDYQRKNADCNIDHDGIELYFDCCSVCVLYNEDENYYEKLTNAVIETLKNVESQEIKELILSEKEKDVEDLIYLINDNFDAKFRIFYFQAVPDDNFVFLSRKEGENCLKRTKHHYSEKAHVYYKSNYDGYEFNKLLRKNIMEVKIGKKYKLKNERNLSFEFDEESCMTANCEFYPIVEIYETDENEMVTIELTTNGRVNMDIETFKFMFEESVG